MREVEPIEPPVEIARDLLAVRSPITTDRASVDKRFAGSVMWTAGSKWTSQVVSWISMLVIARLLSPSDFGLVGMAAVYLALAQNLSEFGFGSAVITLRDLSAQQIKGINTFCLLSGLTGFGISCAVCLPLGWFFRAPQLPAVVVAMSLAFLISGFQTVPYNLLQRDLEFRTISIIDVARVMAQTFTVLTMAWLGFGYWALVAGSLASATTGAAVSVGFRATGFVRPQFHSIRHAIRFGRDVLVSRIAWSLYSDADFIVAGRTLGVGPLGSYTMAWNLANAPIERISSLITSVTPAFLSAVQSDRASLRRYLRSLTEGISLVTTPLTLGMALTARDFVNLALGPKWEGAVVPLELLAVYASFRSLTPLLAQVLITLGETRFVMWNTLGGLVLLPTAFFIGSRWGVSGISWAWILGYPFVALPLYARVFRGIQMRAMDYLAAVLPSVNGAAGMIAAVLILKSVMPAEWPLSLRFGVQVLAGAAAYGLVMMAFHRDRLAKFWNLIHRRNDQPDRIIPVPSAPAA